MRFLEQLLRNLSKIVDEAYGCIPLERIVNAEYVDIALKKKIRRRSNYFEHYVQKKDFDLPRRKGGGKH